jgi:hypothetical protein
MNPKQENWQRAYFDSEDPLLQATLTDEQQQLLKEIKELEGVMFNRRHDTRWTAAQNREYREQKFFEIQERFYARNAAMSAQLQQEAEKHRADYLRRTDADTSRLLLEQRRWENRYAGMSKAQLEEEANAYGSEKDPAKLLAWSPDRLDALSAAALRVRKNPDEVLEKAKQERRYLEPWRYEKPEFYQAMNLYNSEFGVARVVNACGALEDVPVAGVYMEKIQMDEET